MELESCAAAMDVDSSCPSSDSSTGMEMMDAPASAASVTKVGSLEPGAEDVTNDAVEAHRWRCAFCPALAAGPAMLRRHYAEAHPDERPFACELCPERFRDCAGLAAHRAEHARQMQDEPSLQGEPPTPNDQDDRQRAKAAKRTHACGTCGKLFPSRSHLQAHLVTHTGEKPFQCDVCLKRFSQRGNLQVHVNRFHPGEQALQCPRRYKTSEQLQVHTRRVHGGENPFQCTACLKRFSEKYNLKVHMKTHIRKPFQCSDCPKCFKRQEPLKEHIYQTHGGDKPFECTVCPKKLASKLSLEAHAKTHSVRKPFPCSVCAKSFISEESLQAHTFHVHNGENPFTCTVCFKKLSSKGSLKLHLLTHSNSKPYKCSLCSMSYCLKSSLLYHLKTHTKVHKCHKCHKSFALLKGLRKHMLRHSTGKPESFREMGCSELSTPPSSEEGVYVGHEEQSL